MPNKNQPHLSSKNPYIALSTIEPDEQQNQKLTNTVDVTTDDFVVNIPEEMLERAIQIEKYSCTIRYICLIDLIINMYYLTYGYIFSVIFAFASLFGYLSTIYHKRNLLCCYLIYQYMQTFAKSVNFILICSYGTDILITDGPSRDDNNSSNIETYIVYLFFSLFMVICQLIITVYVNKYYNLLPTDEESSKLIRRQLSV